MAKSTLLAAAVQLSPVLGSRSGTTEKVCAAIATAAASGAGLEVFPETVVPYYPYFSFIRPPVSSGPEHMELYEQAVVVPSPETDGIYGQDPQLTPTYTIPSTSPAAHSGAAQTWLDGDRSGRCYADPPSRGAYEAP